MFKGCDDYFMGRMVLLVIAVVASAPSAGTRQPLPDETFLAEARKRLASNALLQSRYTFRERVTEVDFNPFGHLGTGPVEVYEVYPVPGEKMTYRRLVERGGTRVSPPAIAEQDRQYLQRFQQWRRQTAGEGKAARDLREERLAAAREKDRAEAAEITSLFTFTIESRETLGGQPAVLVSFKPKPNAQPRSREARVASSFAGRAWVHEHEREVMRVEAQAISDTAFGFGLVARLFKGATAVFVRGKVGDTWLPMQTRIDGEGRALLLRKIAFNYSREFSDYRPFDWTELPSILGASGSK